MNKFYTTQQYSMQQQADLVQVVDHSAEQDQEAIPMS